MSKDQVSVAFRQSQNSDETTTYKQISNMNNCRKFSQ